MARIEPISQTVAAILTVVLHSFARTVAANVWVETLSVAAKGISKWQKEKLLLIRE